MSKPEVKISLASKGHGEKEYVDLFAFWRNDKGHLSGKVDRGIASIVIKRRDGSTEEIAPDEKGYLEGWFINARVESAQAAPQRGQQRPPQRTQSRPQSGNQRAGRDEFPTDDFVDDDIPFDGAREQSRLARGRSVGAPDRAIKSAFVDGYGNDLSLEDCFGYTPGDQ